MASIVTPRFQLNLMVDDRDKTKQVYNINSQTNKIVLNPSYLHNETAKAAPQSDPYEIEELNKLKRGKIVSFGTSCSDMEDTFSQSTTTGGKNIHNRSEKSITLGTNSNIVKVKIEEKTPEFDEAAVQDIIKEVLKIKLQGITYDHEKFRDDSAAISLEIHDRLKKICQSDTYKLSVNVFVGEVRGEGIETATLCSWDPQYDCIVCGYYKNTSVFAIATVFASYFP